LARVNPGSLEANPDPNPEKPIPMLMGKGVVEWKKKTWG